MRVLRGEIGFVDVGNIGSFEIKIVFGEGSVPLRWKIYAVIFSLLMILGLSVMFVTGDTPFELCRNMASGLLGSLAIICYAFRVGGMSPTAWKFIFGYCVADAVYDLFHLLRTEDLLTTLIGYPFEILVLFPMFLGLFRLAFRPKDPPPLP